MTTRMGQEAARLSLNCPEMLLLGSLPKEVGQRGPGLLVPATPLAVAEAWQGHDI